MIDRCAGRQLMRRSTLARSRHETIACKAGMRNELYPTPEQQEIRAAVARLCEQFGDQYWLKKSHRFFPKTLRRVRIRQ
jgi:hypothetical protein